MSSPERTGLPCAILFADVCGGTDLYNAMGNARAQTAITQMLATLSHSIARHLGRVIKTIGAEIMCIFSSPQEAAQAAVDMQRSLQREMASMDIAGVSLAVRVGFHYGPVISQGTDVFGDAVNVAARVVAHAKPGQILITRETVRELPRALDTNVRVIGTVQVKGRTEPVDLLEVIWEREDMTLARALSQTTTDNIRLSASMGPMTIELGIARRVLHMGRGTENDFVVNIPHASRVHARIEHRRNHFVLIDQSLNGTHIHMHGTSEIVLHRDEVVLGSSGLIGLGRSTADEQYPHVRFTLYRS